MKRREFFSTMASYGALAGSASVMFTAGGIQKAHAAGKAVKTVSMPAQKKLGVIGAFYTARAADAQQAQYSTKAYLADATLAGGLGGLVVDTADIDHTPFVKGIGNNPDDATMANLSVVCTHAVNATHNIGGVDIWVDDGEAPMVEFATPAADIATGLTVFDYVIPIPKAALTDSAYLVLVAHCNLHGGHINFNDGYTLDI